MTNEKVEQIFEKEIEVAEAMLEQKAIVCEFCGQLLIDDRNCGCSESCEARRKESIIQDALETTLPMLTDEEYCEKIGFDPITNDELLIVLKYTIKNVGKGIIQRSILKVDDDTTFTIQEKSGYIEISRKENTSKIVKLGG